MTTHAPRTRDGASFPGGKFLRRAHARLAARRKAHADTKKSPGRQPGSMKK